MFRKKGLSTVVTTLIIILLVLVAIGIVWVVIANLVEEGSEQIFLDKFTTSLDIKNVNIDNSTDYAEIDVKRNPGKGDLEGLKFIVNDGQNSEIIEFTNVNLQELGQKRFNFTLSQLDIDNVKTISIAPLYRSNSGKRITGGIIASYNMRQRGCEAEPLATTCGSWICGSRTNNCGISVSCGDCPGQVCSSDHLSCENIVTPCTFSSIVWSPPGTVVQGTSSLFTITSTGQCNGEDVEVSVWEDDTAPFPDTEITSTPIIVQLDATNTATGTWQASWIDDGGTDPDPEYFLKASLVNYPSQQIEGSQLKEDELTVLGTCADKGGTECTGEQYCSGNTINASDTTRCCDATCEDPTCTTCDTCGDGLFNICDRAECYSCTGDSCFFLDLMVDECNTCTVATCESYDTDQTTCTDDPCGFGDCEWSGSSCYTEGTLTCAQLGGTECTGEQYCSGNTINASDTTRCCDATCEDPTCTTCDTCGDGLFNICDRAECYACTGDSCFFLDLMVDECNTCTAATCESYDTDQTTCTDDPCGFGDCEWSGSSCVGVTYPTSYVIRGMPTTVSPNEQFTVTLDIYADNTVERLFAIEEIIPSAFTLISNDFEGDTPDAHILRQYAAQGFCCINAEYHFSYVVEAPSSTGTYPFDGIYVFESTVVMITSAPTCGNGICEVNENDLQGQSEVNSGSSYHCPQDCEGDPMFGPITVTVA